MLFVARLSYGRKHKTFTCTIARKPHHPEVQCHDPMLWVRKVGDVQHLLKVK